MKRIGIYLSAAIMIAATQAATAQATGSPEQGAAAQAVGTEDEDALFGGPAGDSEATGGGTIACTLK
jgi:hypothetical protein